MLAYAINCGLTAAELKKFSIGYVVSFIDVFAKIKRGVNIHAEEEKYLKLKSILPFVTERLKNGEVSEQEYNEFMKDYKKLEDKYEF